MKLALWVQRQWQHRGLFALLLWPLSMLYCSVMTLRRRVYEAGFFKQYSTGLPVIVIGNLSVGGTGKTPLVMWLADRLARAGYRPGIITRGYGGSAEQFPLLVRPGMTASICGDEAAMMARQVGCPVVVDPDRVAAARWLENHHACDVILADDGLQHLRLARDLNVVVINNDRIDGNGLCLPAGPLRERASRLQDMDLVLSRQPDSDLTDRHYFLVPGECAQVGNPASRLPLEKFLRGPVHAVAGIAHPEVFFNSLRSAGLEIITHVFPDHYPFSPEDLQFSADYPLIMTQKDAVRCAHFSQPDWWMLTVRASPDEGILQPIFKKLEELEKRG